MIMGRLGPYRYPRWWMMPGHADPTAAQKLASAARLLMVERATLLKSVDAATLQAIEATPCERLLEAWMHRFSDGFLHNIQQLAEAAHPDTMGNRAFRDARFRVYDAAERVLDARRAARSRPSSAPSVVVVHNL